MENIGLYSRCVTEASRLNQRFEANKMNPAWTQDMLAILIIAQHDIVELAETLDHVPQRLVFSNAVTTEKDIHD